MKIKESLKIFRHIPRMVLFTIPLFIILWTFVWFDKLEQHLAMWIYFLSLPITFIWVLPFLEERQKMMRYIYLKTKGLNARKPRFRKYRKDSVEIITLINEFKKSWESKLNILKNQTILDSVVLDYIPLPILFINPNFKIVQTNQAAQIFFKENLNDMDLTSILPISIEQLKQENKISNLTCSIKNKYLSLSIQKLSSIGINGSDRIIIISDLTKFKKLEESEKIFFADVSHELKTPLSVLSGLIETLQGPARDDVGSRDKFLKIMSSQIEHMSELINNLLSICRLELKTPEKTTLLIPASLSVIIQNLATRSQENNQKIELKVTENLPPMLINQNSFFILYQNLIENAIKYGKKKSTITVSVSLGKINDLPSVDISVHNFGLPISTKDLPHIFERFYRANKRVSGTGLGLYIVHEIIKKLDGQIEVTSNRQDGTLFSTKLPITNIGI